MGGSLAVRPGRWAADRGDRDACAYGPGSQISSAVSAPPCIRRSGLRTARGVKSALLNQRGVKSTSWTSPRPPKMGVLEARTLAVVCSQNQYLTVKKFKIYEGARNYLLKNASPAIDISANRHYDNTRLN